jgi:surface antigen
MPNAAGAYALSTRTIYLNDGWMATAGSDQLLAVLTEELGHHLDGLMNQSDTPGDEGEVFAALLQETSLLSDADGTFSGEVDFGQIYHSGEWLDVEMSIISPFSIDTSHSGYTRFNNDFISLNWSSTEANVGGQRWNAMQCTSYAYGRAIELGYFGNLQGLGARIRNRDATPDHAKYWDDNVGVVGNSVGTWNYIPRRHSIVVWENLGSTGHVGFVETVNYGSDGRVSSFVVSEHNLNFDGRYTSRTISRGSSNFNAKFIYLTNDSATPTPNPPPPPPADARVALPIFDPQYYLATYSDVRDVYQNAEGARWHWLNHGISEGRRGSLVFDPQYYLQRHQDVANVYGPSNYAAAIGHWLEHGLREGRRGSAEFDPIYYMAANPDVEQAYNPRNFSGAISHFYNHGIRDGRPGSEAITDSAAFDLGYYLANNQDVFNVTNNSNQDVEATRHWFFIGVNEGRRGSIEFDSKFYLANNADVRIAYGEGNYRGALDHYLTYGKRDGRIGADDRPRALSIGDASLTEGNSGSRSLVFTVSLNIVTGETVSVSYSTANGSALSGIDFVSASGSLLFSPGETSKSVSVTLLGDTQNESNETFFVSLSGASYAAISRGQAVGTILNDDVPLPVNNGRATFSINGSASVGQVLTAVKGSDDPDGNGTFSYRWQSSPNGTAWTNIGANSPSLTVANAEEALRVRVVISYVDSEGFAESITTSPVTISPRSSITGILDNVGLIQGSVSQGGRTDDLTPTITGTLSVGLAAGEGLRVFNGSALLGTASVDHVARTWSLTPNLPSSSGTSYSFTARVVDASGNLGAASAARTMILDTTAPVSTAAIAAVGDNAGFLTGAVSPAGLTDDRTPAITGTLSAPLAAGETLRVFNRDALLGSATVNNAARTWSFTPTLPSASGESYSISVRVADSAGNLGPSSPARNFVLDSTPPATTVSITGVSDNVGLLQGTVTSAGRTDDLTPTISGVLSAPLSSGETLRIFRGSTHLGNAIVNNTNRTWTFTPTLEPSSGTSYGITARVSDAAGNLGPASPSRSFVLDTAAPGNFAVLSTITDNFGLIQGSLSPGGRTDDRSPTFSGTISGPLGAGETLRVFNGATLLGSASVNNTARTWSFTTTLTDTTGTTYAITARVADAAGNLGTASAVSTFILDTTPNLIVGTANDDSLTLTNAPDRLTGLGGRDTIVLPLLTNSLLGAASQPTFDRITDLITGVDRIDAPVARSLATAVNPVVLGAVSDLTNSSIAALLSAAVFPALTTTSSAGAATFTFNDPTAGTRTFLAINNGTGGFSATTDAIVEITGFSGTLSQLQVY